VEYVILVLALPLVVVALVGTFRRRRAPAPTAAVAEPAAAAAPVSAPVAGAWLVRRLLPWLVVALLVTAAVIFFSPYLAPESFLGNVLRLTALCRYGLLTGLLLVGLVPLGLQGKPDLLGNLFVLRARRHLFHVAWLSVLVGAMAVVVCRVEELNAPARFGTHAVGGPGVLRDVARAAAVLVLCLPVLLACLRNTREGTLRQESWAAVPWALAMIAGLATGFFLLVLAAAVQPTFLSAEVIAPDLFPAQPLGQWAWEHLGAPHSDALLPAERGVADLLQKAPGYTVRNAGGEPRLATGHAQLTAAMAAVLLVYMGYYLVGMALGTRADRLSQFPALFLLLLVLLLLGFFLQGAAFALDLYWLPASLALVLVAFALYQGFHTDHLFSLGWTKAAGGVRARAAEAGGPREAPTLKDAAAAWAWREGEKRTLVAVAASGGGIQAAAWTARVLVGLHERYGDNFTRSVRLLSAVSGGSVGALYCLDSWPPDGSETQGAWQYPAGSGLPTEGSVCARAMASSLEATAWGLAFPDLLRVMAPFLVARTDDRGARIEEAWRDHMRHPKARLIDWTSLVLDGQMPIPVFNATVVETGQRFLAAPVLGPASDGPPSAQARQLVELYPGAAPLASTMVRLSATFPFVSPICRPEWSKKEPWLESASYHFADGGYVDNEGMVTLIEWLTALLDPTYIAAPPFDRVLLVRLMPFPSAAPAPASLDRGWFYSTLGPIDAIQNVRTASQQERNDLAVRLFTAAAAAKGVEVRAAVLRYELPAALDPPLSWMLTDPQKADVDRAWRLLAAQGPRGELQKIDGWFPPRRP
jgi:hypothetical protein